MTHLIENTNVLHTLAPMEFWAFFENSDFQRLRRGALYRQDEVRLIRHDEFLHLDYALMTSIGCVGIRDAARWYVTHTAPDVFDWTWLDQVVAAAAKHQLKLYLDLWHYGYPDWLDLMSADAPAHFAHFAREIVLRYPSIQYYCVSNEPTLMVENAGRRGRWHPFLRGSAVNMRHQICRMIIEASRAILEVKPDAILVLPEPWHASHDRPEDEQAAVIDTVMGLRDPYLGGSSDLVHVVGLNHYRDSRIPPFHRMIRHAQERWQNKPIWLTETSGPPFGWKQSEWFWWMMAEVQLARLSGVSVPVFTWAPIISMYDWIHEERQLHNGVWKIGVDGQRIPNELMIESIRAARQYGYLR